MTRQKLFMILGFGAAFAFAMVTPSPGLAGQATEICDNGVDDDGDKDVDCDDSDCAEKCKPETPKEFCHNIGGPEATGGGADCDPETDECTVTDEETGRTFTVNADQYFGIVIGASDNALDAHIRHGDGPALVIIDPPLHLASQGDIHRASNVECIGDRVNEQPPEPGN